MPTAARILTSILLLLLLTGCERKYTVTEQMTWECLPNWYTHDYPGVVITPGAQAVRFRYVENPHAYDVITGRDLCRVLESSSKGASATVTIEAWGQSDVRGYTFVAVNGQPIVNAGGFGVSGSEGAGQQHPLSKYFVAAHKP
jgi:hypothetical protein